MSSSSFYTTERRSAFTVEIDGVMVGGVHRVDGIEHEHEVVEYQDGDDMYTHLRPGRQKQGRIRMVRNYSNTSEFYEWFRAVQAGKGQRKSISLVFNNERGEATMLALYD